MSAKFIYILVAICLGHCAARSVSSYSDPQMLTMIITVDVSNSMEGDKLMETAQALQKWILDDLQDGIEVGFVQFSSSARVLSKPSPLNDAKRLELISVIPTDAQGEGLVDRGLEKAIEELESKESELVIVLITDIEKSEKISNIYDITNKVKELDIEVFTIAIGNDAKINDFADLANGGLTFHLTDENSTSSSIRHALEEIMLALDLQQSPTTLPTTLNVVSSTTTTHMDVVSQEVSPVAATEDAPFINSNSDKITEFVTPVVSNPEVLESAECNSNGNCNDMSYWVVIGIITGSVIVLLALIILIGGCLIIRKYKLVSVRGSYHLIHK